METSLPPPPIGSRPQPPLPSSGSDRKPARSAPARPVPSRPVSSQKPDTTRQRPVITVLNARPMNEVGFRDHKPSTPPTVPPDQPSLTADQSNSDGVPAQRTSINRPKPTEESKEELLIDFDTPPPLPSKAPVSVSRPTPAPRPKSGVPIENKAAFMNALNQKLGIGPQNPHSNHESDSEASDDEAFELPASTTHEDNVAPVVPKSRSYPQGIPVFPVLPQQRASASEPPLPSNIKPKPTLLPKPALKPKPNLKPKPMAAIKPVTAEPMDEPVEEKKRSGPEPMRATYRPTIIRASKPPPKAEETSLSKVKAASTLDISEPKEPTEYKEPVEPLPRKKPTIIRASRMSNAISMPNIAQASKEVDSTPSLFDIDIEQPVEKENKRNEEEPEILAPVKKNAGPPPRPKAPPARPTFPPSFGRARKMSLPSDAGTSDRIEPARPASPLANIEPSRPATPPTQISLARPESPPVRSEPPRPASPPGVKLPANEPVKLRKNSGPRPPRPMSGPVLPVSVPKKEPTITVPHAVAVFDYTASEADELAFKVGEVILLDSKAGPDWLKGSIDHRSGMFPANFVQVKIALPDSQKLEMIGPRCEAKFDYEGTDANDLSFPCGAVIALKEKVGTEWAKGEIDGRVGMFPLAFVAVIEDLPPVAESVQEVMERPPNAATATDNYVGGEGELSFACGADITVLAKVDDDQLYGQLYDEVGTFPASYVDRVPEDLPMHTATTKKKPETDDQLSEELVEEVDESLPHCVALHDFTGEASTDLSFSQGQKILLLRHVDGDWLEGKCQGYEGMFPSAFVEIIKDLPTEVLPPRPAATPILGHAKALHDFTGQEDGDLSFSAGDEITVIKRIDADWLLGRLGDSEGQFPEVFVDMSHCS